MPIKCMANVQEIGKHEMPHFARASRPFILDAGNAPRTDVDAQMSKRPIDSCSDLLACAPSDGQSFAPYSFPRALHRGYAFGRGHAQILADARHARGHRAGSASLAAGGLCDFAP